jgi:hypothetical protein
MPQIHQKLHGWRRKRVVLRELELGGKHTALKGCVLGTLDQAFPVEDVVLGDGPCGDALWRVVCERAILLQEASLCG